jgi:hypothetical protein
VVTKIISKVAVGGLSDPHCRLVLVAPQTMTRGRPALYPLAKAMPAVCKRRQDGMEGDQGGGGSQGGNQRRVAGDGPADDGAHHDAQHHVERRGLAHEALLALANRITAV